MIVVKKSFIDEFHATWHDYIKKAQYLKRWGYPGHYKYKYYEPDGVSHGGTSKKTENLSPELAQLKTDCFTYAKDNFMGHKFKNVNTGFNIEVSRVGLDEWVSKSKSKEQILSIKRLDEILINAKYKNSSENIHSERQDKATFDYYEYPMEINGKKFNAVVSIKSVVEGKGKNTNTRKIYYHHFLDDIKITEVK